MNQIVNAQPMMMGPVSSRFQNLPAENDLAEGISGGYGLVTYKGKVWTLRHRGADTHLMRPDGDGPLNSIEVVVLKGATGLSKIWYENGYVEGSNAAPDCASSNGVMPDNGVPKKQNPVCATCPRNAWGSDRRGGKGKDCADSRRIAVVPLIDIPNEFYGGPMLLRVPAASLQDLAAFSSQMQNQGYPYYAIGIRISFDPQESFPKFKFNAIRPLTDAEADVVLALRGSAEVERIVSEAPPAVQQIAAQAPAQQLFEQPPAAPPVQQPAQPVAQPVQQPQPAPQAAQGGFGGVSQPVQQQVAQPAPQPVQQAQPAPVQQPVQQGGFGGAAPQVQPATQPPAAQAALSGASNGGGFGGVASPAPTQPVQQSFPDAANGTVQPQIVSPAPATQEFDASLDARLAALMGNKTA